jgi:hypothetical protein
MEPKDNETPPWLSRIAIFWFAQTENRRFSKRLRSKNAWQTDPSSLRLEADEMVRREIGSFPSESAFDPDEDPEELAQLEASMRRTADDFFESLQETESYSWGLAIAGIFHLWERDACRAIAELNVCVPSNLESADFKKLCGCIKSTGFDIVTSEWFGHLECAHLITNTIKHGDGPSARQLLKKRPDLFLARQKARGLRVGQPQFEEAVTAIDRLWGEYEDAYLRWPGRIQTETLPRTAKP